MKEMDNDGNSVEIDEAPTSAERSGCFGDLSKVEQAAALIREVLQLCPDSQPSKVNVTDESVSVKFCGGRKKVKGFTCKLKRWTTVVKTLQGGNPRRMYSVGDRAVEKM